MKTVQLDDLLGLPRERLQLLQHTIDVRVDCLCATAETADERACALLSAEVQELAAFWLRCQRAIDLASGRTTAA